MGSKNTSKFAFIASQGLLSSMLQLVPPQIINIKWDKVAINACLRCVPACGSSNCFFLKILVTKNAHWRLFPRVGPIVVAQMTLLWCFLITLSAIILSFCSFSFFKLFLRGLLLCFTKHMYFFSPKNVYLLCYQACDSSTLLKRWNLFHEICKSASRKWLLPSMAQYLVLQGSMRWKLSVTNLPSSWAERASRQCVQADGFLKLFCEMTRCHRCCKIES